MQQASLNSGPCKLIQVLQHRQGLCWLHRKGHKNCLLPDTFWPQISGWVVALFWAFYEDPLPPLPGRYSSAAAVPDIVQGQQHWPLTCVFVGAASAAHKEAQVATVASAACGEGKVELQARIDQLKEHVRKRRAADLLPPSLFEHAPSDA